MKLAEFLERFTAAVVAKVDRTVADMERRFVDVERRIESIPAGERGEQGEKGDTGDRGLPGDRGEKGEKGDAGDRGLPGDRGEKGEKGDAGDRGLAGERGEKGEKGDAGDRGLAGERGEKGEQGTPGRDALDLNILPAIDETRAYPRGTYARHRGGLWKAVADTLGMRNWECIVNGLCQVEVEAKDERTEVIRIAMADGQVVEHARTFWHPLDRGVFREGADYGKGDGVTWAGSWWIAQVDKTTDKPGTSEHWRLAVKRGRDGKDAK